MYKPSLRSIRAYTTSKQTSIAGALRDNGVAASVTCQDDGCSRLSIKVSCHSD